MKFQNTNESAELNFSILGETYKVEPGGEVDIIPAHVPWVLRRGLQLKPVMFKPKPKPEAKPAKPAEPKSVPAVEAEKQEKPAKE